MNIIALSFNALTGLIVGSFLNVLAVRYREGDGVFTLRRAGGRSRCPHCGKRLGWQELIPVISFVVQAGRCRSCRARLSWQYPAVELATAAAFLVPYYTELSWWWVLVAVLMILLSAIDARLMIIPDGINAALAGIGVLIALTGSQSFLGSYAAVFPGFPSVLVNHAAGGVIGFVALLLVVLTSRGKAMGMGDVKLAGAMGIILGFPDIFFALAWGFLAGGAWSAMLLLLRRTGLQTMVPFGPFLVAGFWAHVFFTASFLKWYFSLL